jgi:hypothetical protein
MSGIAHPDDMSRWAERALKARNQAGDLHDQAMLLGYNVAADTSGEPADLRVGTTPMHQEPTVLFMVRRVDQPPETTEAFTTADAVKEHLAYLATLPRYCLDLEDNARIEVTSDAEGTATLITDKDTGQSFDIRTVDLENATRLCVHAEAPPTVGNWRAQT